MLKYKLYLIKPIDLNKDILNNSLEFATIKNFKVFKGDHNCIEKILKHL